MRLYNKFYINGEWTEPQSANLIDVINPATETVCGQVSMGSSADVDRAVAAARTAFLRYGHSSRQQRIEWLDAICESYRKYYHDIADAISEEMGAPTRLAVDAQARSGLGHLTTALKILRHYTFEERAGKSLVIKEPIGVCGLITPWNWPMNQITCKVAPALAVGCPVILKPSEIAPISAYLFSRVIDEAGVPAGIYNMINGDGPGVGTAIASHPQIDMVSFTGSTRAGVLVARNAAATVKRVTQELGGKSPNIILPDADLQAAVTRGVKRMFVNSGQSCNAPSRMLVPAHKMNQVADIAASVASQVVVGDPKAATTTMGPVVSKQQYNKIQQLIQSGIDEGATLVCGGTGLPAGIECGYFVRPTIFADVSNTMTIAREEIFGPVLAIIPYKDEQQAVELANDTRYGLAAYIQGENYQQIRSIASQLRAGNIAINGVSADVETPFGGYKQSGNGREWGRYGFSDYLEIKAISGLGV